MPIQNNFGQVYNSGVKYIKVNKTDSNGSDRSSYLGELQTLRIVYDNIGPKDYNIITTQEQTNYYVFGVEPVVQPTSSIDYYFPDFSLDVQANANFVIPSNSLDSYQVLTNYNLVTTNPLNYFDTSTGKYTFGLTPNVPITASFTADLKISAGGFVFNDNNISIRLFGPNYGFGTSLPLLDISGFDSSSFTPISGSVIIYPKYGLVEGSYAQVEITNVDSSGDLTIRNFNLVFTPELSSTPSNPQFTLFVPDYVDTEYSDYNPIFGNASQPQYSNIYMDIDYTTTYAKPVNFELILSGTADKAQIQDSNYAAKSWSDIRYNGSRQSSYDFNVPF